jgi:hypothetical protein
MLLYVPKTGHVLLHASKVKYPAVSRPQGMINDTIQNGRTKPNTVTAKSFRFLI